MKSRPYFMGFFDMKQRVVVGISLLSMGSGEILINVAPVWYSLKLSYTKIRVANSKATYMKFFNRPKIKMIWFD